MCNINYKYVKQIIINKVMFCLYKGNCLKQADQDGILSQCAA